MQVTPGIGVTFEILEFQPDFYSFRHPSLFLTVTLVIATVVSFETMVHSSIIFKAINFYRWTIRYAYRKISRESH